MFRNPPKQARLYKLTKMKDELRYKYKILRKYFQNIQRMEADRAILECFSAAYMCYDSFFIYNSMGTEADTKEIIKTLLAAGKKVYLPRVEDKDIVPVLYGELKRGAFGIEEPAGEPYCGKIDVTVIPLLAVNGRGFRLATAAGITIGI